jgi:hypothetical protein
LMALNVVLAWAVPLSHPESPVVLGLLAAVSENATTPTAANLKSTLDSFIDKSLLISFSSRISILATWRSEYTPVCLFDKR